MQDLSQYKKKETIEINTRFVFPILTGTIVVTGLIFALGVLVGNNRSSDKSVCQETDILSRLNEESKEPAPPEEVDETTFYKRLAVEDANIPMPASIRRVGVQQNNKTEEAELENVQMEEPKMNEGVVPEKIRDDEADIFTLQVGSFQDKREASLMVQRLKKAGHKSFLVRVNMPDEGEWFRVRVGPFTSKKDAWVYKNEFETQERMPAFVVKRRG
ncbi:MAG: SPOR domain-containing protein [Deltaproteobacteria bacterium]|nr:SPOR domain-containing protein [Deltaproteobacteria bacterium]